ncbi:hypothetical protein K7432_011720 [Basidiobolus ranarum]|uniref:Phospho-2-dehydro-3-deoxyheptonate aldolase n=1 Tax=Basidiobolus ranarum TaxID=34480 RepID=A0ABR2WLS9_9FUNG
MDPSKLVDIFNQVELDISKQATDSKAEWSPSSWRNKKVTQDVIYEDKEELDQVLAKLHHLPPMTSPREIKNLREQLSDVALGKSFLLQGGDCAELFEYCNKEHIENKIKIILQMSLILTWGARIPVVRIARMAGQYAKPRSKPTEMVDGEEVLSFRGDNVNGFDPSDRKPDPQRLLGAYFHSAASMNYVRSILHSGFADLHDTSAWDLHHFRDSQTREEYQTIANRLSDALNYMKVVGADVPQIRNIDLFTSHEGLVLPYEEALTRQLPDPDTHEMKWYNTSAHFIWIGDRTRQIDGAHVEYFSGIENPIGIKCGPSMEPQELTRLLDIVNPKKEIGKVTLITRYGCNLVDQFLPGHIKAVQESGHVVDYTNKLV